MRNDRKESLGNPIRYPLEKRAEIKAKVLGFHHVFNTKSLKQWALAFHPKTSFPTLDTPSQSSPLELAFLVVPICNPQNGSAPPATIVSSNGGPEGPLFLAKRCKELTSIEHAPNWFEQVERSQRRRESNSLRHRQINLESEKEFLASPYAKALQSTQDAIVIGEDILARNRIGLPANLVFAWPSNGFARTAV